MTQVHQFDSTGEAYDASQCRDDIHDGDVLFVPSEGVAGFLYKAWPVAVTEACGAFHSLSQGSDWETMALQWSKEEHVDYLTSLKHARILAAGLASKTVEPIALEYRSLDGVRKTTGFATLEAARDYAHKWVGEHPECTKAYAVSDDGIGMVKPMRGCTLADLFPVGGAL
jgi:hypothetical protein